jgi:hypothetical protein
VHAAQHALWRPLPDRERIKVLTFASIDPAAARANRSAGEVVATAVPLGLLSRFPVPGRLRDCTAEMAPGQKKSVVCGQFCYSAPHLARSVCANPPSRNPREEQSLQILP